MFRHITCYYDFFMLNNNKNKYILINYSDKSYTAFGFKRKKTKLGTLKKIETITHRTWQNAAQLFKFEITLTNYSKSKSYFMNALCFYCLLV